MWSTLSTHCGLPLAHIVVYAWHKMWQTFQTYYYIQANSVDPDQTSPKGAVWSGSTLLQKRLLKSQADDKAADNSCDWRFKG